jgi:hypothetical protein
MAARTLTPEQQFGGQLILDYLLDLFTISPKSDHTTGSVLVVLNAVKNNPELFERDIVLAYEEAVKDVP